MDIEMLFWIIVNEWVAWRFFLDLVSKSDQMALITAFFSLLFHDILRLDFDVGFFDGGLVALLRL